MKRTSGPRTGYLPSVTSEGTDTSAYGDDPGGAWAAVVHPADRQYFWDTDRFVLLTDQRAWKRAVESDFPPDGDITVDPHTLMPLSHWVDHSLGVMSFVPDLAQSALEAAAWRVMSVDEQGREALTEADVDALETSGLYSPQYVSEAERRGDVVGWSTLDTTGRRYPWMFRTILRIVAEELRAAGALPARIVPFSSSRIHYPSDAELA